jgi:hypothetical protein
VTWAPDYATSAELKAYARINDTVDDVQVALAITASSRAIDRYCGRQFGQVASAAQWTYTAQWDRRRCRHIVRIDDLATTTSLVVDLNGTAVTDYTLEPRNAVVKGGVWTELVFGQGVGGIVFGTDVGGFAFGSGFPDSTIALDGVTITALWGWSSVPAAVKQACLFQANRLLARRDSPFGVAGSPADGSELRLLATLDPDVKVALGRYQKFWGAV